LHWNKEQTLQLGFQGTVSVNSDKMGKVTDVMFFAPEEKSLILEIEGV